ncbi:MAG: transglycosylase SLT domain-containing protein [Candidatus Pacearchaeota archaeon]
MAKAGKSLLDKVTEGAAKFAINIGAVNGAFGSSEYVASQDFSEPLQLLTFGASSIGIYAANQKGLVSKASEKINGLRNKASEKWRPAATNAISTALLGATIITGASGLSNEVSNIYNDFNPSEKISEKKERPNPDKEKGKEKTFEGINSSRLSMEGKFQRARRFKDIYQKFEREYDIPRHTLGPLAMTESHGNPVQLNTPGDGGAGLYQFQPGTARAYGLDVRGESNAMGADTNHAKSLRKICEEHGYQYKDLAKVDERFHVVKSSDAAAKYMETLIDRYGGLKEAVSAYNLGSPAEKPSETSHVRRFQKFREYYKENIK